MASSRWKRFAFFDRHTLNLPSQVLEDLLPSSDEHRSSPSSVCSMVLNTAALPRDYHSQQASNHNVDIEGDDIGADQQQKQALSAMLSSLTACAGGESTTTQLLDDDDDQVKNIHLPSQQQQRQSQTTTTSSITTAMDGLVLVWVASPKSPFCHCLDITVRCNNVHATTSDDDGDDQDNATIDMDGWRGYFLASDNENEGVVDVAACRMAARPENSINASDGDGHSPLYVACLTSHSVSIFIDPHVQLSCRLPVTAGTTATSLTTITLASPWNESQHGSACTLDISSDGLLAVGTDTGHVLLYTFEQQQQHITLKLTIPPPPSQQSATAAVTCVKLDGTFVFCTYRKGISCFEISMNNNNAADLKIQARHDLDSRPVLSSAGVDYSNNNELVVARPDGLYTFSQTKKVGVSPIDGTKNCICVVPPPLERKVLSHGECNAANTKSTSYALVASTDTKSGR